MVLQLDMLQYKVSVVQDQRLLSRLAQSNTSKLQGSGGGEGQSMKYNVQIVQKMYDQNKNLIGNVQICYDIFSISLRHSKKLKC